jgi:hypothetical protein
MSTRRVLLCSLSLFLFALLTVSAFADSQVRIVRLSNVEGNVQIDRNAGQGFERAFLNLPIVQGAKLKTGNEGRAEVEFEDGSTMRIVPGTLVEFPQLTLRDSGTRASTIDLQQGMAYVNFSGNKSDEMRLTFRHEAVVLNEAAHLRLAIEAATAELAVFKGSAQVEGPSGAVNLSKKQTLKFDLADQDRYKLAKNVEEYPYDSWEKEQDQYHQRYATTAYNSYSPYAYGVSDLNYYGNFFNAAGYGTLWRPYFAGAGWDPFMSGAWAYSPGAGYGWVSAYPWGWTPYHYGSWVFVPSYGWAWQPGGQWYGAGSPIRVVNAPATFRAPQAPINTARSTILVNRGPVPVLGGRSGDKVVIRNDSAGLGVPRGGIKNVSKVSQSVSQRGSVQTSVRTAPIRSPASVGAQPGIRGGAQAGAGVSMSNPASRSVSPTMRAPASSPSGSSRGSAGGRVGGGRP